MAETCIAPPAMALRKTMEVIIKPEQNETGNVTAMSFGVTGAPGARKLRYYTTPAVDMVFDPSGARLDPAHQELFTRIMLDPKCRNLLTAMLLTLTGDGEVIEMGPLAEDCEHPESHQCKGVWRGVVARKAVGAINGVLSWYPTFSDLGTLFKVDTAAVEVHESLSDGGAEGERPDYNDFTWLVAWLHNMTPRLATNYLVQWKRSFSHWIITSIEEGGEGQLNVVWNDAIDPSKLTPSTNHILGGLLIDYLETDDSSFNTEYNGILMQDDISGTMIDRICVQNEAFEFNRPGEEIGSGTGVMSEEDIQNRSTLPDDVEPFDLTSSNSGDAAATVQLVTKIPTSKKELGCQSVETNTACLQLAQDLGVASQTSYKRFKDSGPIPYAELSASKLKSKYKVKSKTVKVAFANEMNRKITQAEVAEYNKGGLSAVANERGKELVEFLKTTLLVDPENPPPVGLRLGGEEWYVIKSAPAGLVLPTYGDKKALMEFPNDEPLASTVAGKEFMSSIYGSGLTFPLVISKNEVSGLKSKNFMISEDVVIGGQHYSISVLDEVGQIEYNHCIEKYKKLAAEGNNDPKQADDTFSMWWLLLLAVPVIAVLIVLATRNKKPETTAQSPVTVVINSPAGSEVPAAAMNEPQKELVSL